MLKTKYVLFTPDTMLHNSCMVKNKVQVVMYSEINAQHKEFLIFKTNERRGLFWQNVTGSANKNEPFIDAAFREVFEESNCTKENIQEVIDLDMDFNFKDQWNDEVTEKVFAFKIDKNFEVKIDSSEHVEFKWIHQDQLKNQEIKFETNMKAIEKCLSL